VNQTESLRDLVGDMRAGKVDLPVIMGGNPVYDAPAIWLADALKSSNSSLRIHHGLHQNETSEHCHWHGMKRTRLKHGVILVHTMAR
jgi:molybdopterin-containing oxidoreductase family iron-sulfur binding subunit